MRNSDWEHHLQVLFNVILSLAFCVIQKWRIALVSRKRPSAASANYGRRVNENGR